MPAPEEWLQIHVEPRVELLMTVQSTSDLYREERILYPHPSVYRDAAFALAAQWNNHAAATLFQDLAGSFNMDAPVSFVLCHSRLPDLQPVIPYSPYLIGRAGGADRLRAFADALRAFAADACFLAHLQDWHEVFGQFEAQARSVIDPEWPRRLDEYAGRNRAQVHVCLAPLSEGNYGPSFETPQGLVSYSVIKPLPSPTGPRFDHSRIKELVFHEGAHWFVNPAMEACMNKLEESARLFDPIRAKLEDQRYGGWRIVVCEHIVRAVVARLSSNTEEVLAQEEARGFIYIRMIAHALAEYEDRRDVYPDFWCFAPEIAARLVRIAER